MKRIVYGIILVVISMMMITCKEGDVANKCENPNWKFTEKADYSVSMTAAIQLPSNLAPYLTEDDQMVALVGEEVRGVANLFEDIFYIQIQGTDDELVDVTFQYWNAKTQFKYQAEEVYPFKQDEILGTPDEPLVLNFKII